MKNHFLLLILIILTNSIIYSQHFKSDTRISILKEDGNNIYKSDKITNLDLIQALEVVGISINKYNLGFFDKEYKFFILMDEYKNGENIKSDTILDYNNKYIYFVEGEKDYYSDYIDQIKIISKVDDSTLTLHFSTYGIKTKEEIQYTKYDKESFYNLRSYTDTKWSLNKKIPLLVYASSWKDKRRGFQRFCGVVNLSRNNKETDALLTSSPHYYMISYLISE